MMPNLAREQTAFVTRRHFLRDCQLGLGGVALASLLADDGRDNPAGSADPLLPRPPHFPARYTEEQMKRF